jgi:glycosyltransferase involved in cell wall biosynthesis
MNRALKHILIAIAYSINYFIYSKIDVIDAVVTLNEAMCKVLRPRIKQNIYVMYGAVDLTKFKPMKKEDALAVLPKEITDKVNGRFIVLYAGVMSIFQNPLILVDVAKKIRNEYKDLAFIVVGAGPLKQILQKRIKEESLDNIFVFDALPHELMPFIYNISDLALLPPPVLSIPGIREFFIFTLPRKFMEYAACGKPILCITPPCVASNLCLKWKAGYHVDPNDVENVINIIKTLKEDKTLRERLGENARKMAEKLFSVERAVETLRRVTFAGR